MPTPLSAPAGSSRPPGWVPAYIPAWSSAPSSPPPRGAQRDPTKGEHLVLHEFAHQLDLQDVTTTGTPALESRAE